MMHRREFLMALLAASGLNGRAGIAASGSGWNSLFGGEPTGEGADPVAGGRARIQRRPGRWRAASGIVHRYANGAPARLAELAGELVRAEARPAARGWRRRYQALFEAKQGSIPIVGGVSDSPMRAGVAASLARPGKNFTGVTYS